VNQLAKTPTTASPNKPSSNVPLIPKATDPRAELFYLLGRIEGQGVEGSKRLAELVIDLTTAPLPPTVEGEE
jgi:hypothetical protein